MWVQAVRNFDACILIDQNRGIKLSDRAHIKLVVTFEVILKIGQRHARELFPREVRGRFHDLSRRTWRIFEYSGIRFFFAEAGKELSFKVEPVTIRESQCLFDVE